MQFLLESKGAKGFIVGRITCYLSRILSEVACNILRGDTVLGLKILIYCRIFHLLSLKDTKSSKMTHREKEYFFFFLSFSHNLNELSLISI